MLDHLESVLQVTGLEEAQFEDAEEGEDDGAMGNGHVNGNGSAMDEEEQN